MHYTGTIWRPPYEAGSLLLQATAGCTHHRCKFCTLYRDLPYPFRMSPLEQIEADLLEAQMTLRGRRDKPLVRRVLLVGGNPFALEFKRLRRIGELVQTYFPECSSIGCFARITDISAKTDQELRQLGQLGYQGLSIGVETGDGDALAFMDKGFGPEDILRESRRLEEAGVAYHFFYLAGLSGAGRGEEAARRSAALFNRTKPGILGSSMLTVYPGSRLWQEQQAGNWQEAGELEKLRELRTLIRELTVPLYFATLGETNGVRVEGELPGTRKELLAQLDQVLAAGDEGEAALRRYREDLAAG